MIMKTIDLISGIASVALIILMFGASFNQGECEAEVRPILCIPVYKLPSFQQVP